MTAIRDAGKPAAVSVTFRSRGAVTRRPVPSWVKVIKILGDTTAGDGTEYSYKRVASEPGHSDKLQSSDGAWWELVLDSDGGGGGITEINGYTTSEVTLDADDIDDTTTDHKYATAAQLAAIDDISSTISTALTGYLQNTGPDTFTGDLTITGEVAAAVVKATSNQPGIVLYDENASSDEKSWWLRANGTSLYLEARTDDEGSAGSPVLTFTRSGTSITGVAVDGTFQIDGNIGFYNASPAAKPTITGERDANPALASMLTGLAGLGLVTDSTTAGSAPGLDIDGLTDAAAFGSGDKLAIYDTSAGANRRIDYDDLPGAGSFDETSTFTTFSGATTRSLVQRYGYEPINVLDFGADPTGSSSSTSAFNSAFAELRSYAPGTGTAGGRLIIPHNRDATDTYVIDGNGVNATDLRGDGLVMIEAWGARIKGDMNSGLPMIDTSHSQGFTWLGGTLIGDSVNPPRVGLQLTRKYTGTPGNNSNPSSQGHVLLGLATTGQFSVAGMLNYGSEELYAAFCRFENEYDSDTSFAIVQNGMHDTDYLPTSFYDTVGWGEFTGFANNVFHKCFFLHNSGSNGGPGVYLFRASGHHYDAALAQVRENNPHFLIPHIAGEGTNACRDVTISGRYEDSGASALLSFTGDAGAIHHGFRVKIDRMFAQSLAMADSTWTDGAGVALEDVDFRVSNVTPQAVAANPAGYAQIFRNKAKFAHVTGNITVSQRSNAASTYVDIRDFDIDQFNGTLKVSDRDEIPALPGGNFRLYDDTDRQAVEYRAEITYTARISDASGNLSSSQTAKTWQEGDMLHVVFRDLNSISAAGLTGGDAVRVTLPVACSDGDYTYGEIIMTNLASEPTPTGNLLAVRLDVGTGNSYATLRACDSGLGTTALLTVANVTGADIELFHIAYKVT